MYGNEGGPPAWLGGVSPRILVGVFLPRPESV
jgi:hypothetical protein